MNPLYLMAALGLDSPILEAIHGNLLTTRWFREILTFYVDTGFSLIADNSHSGNINLYFKLKQKSILNAQIFISQDKRLLWTEVIIDPKQNSIYHSLRTDSETHELIYSVGTQQLTDYESPEILMQLWKNRILTDLHRGSVIQLQNP